MKTDVLELLPTSAGARHTLLVHRFGCPGAAPKAMFQAALHADEVPAMLVAQQLREQLQALEAAGQLIGEVVLVPYANPLGLSQQVLGTHQGRFNLADGVNFNRQVPDLCEAVARSVHDQLGDDAAANVATVRAALREAAAALPAFTTAADLKRKLLQLSIDADLTFDLHCDHEAVLHLYGLTPQADLCAELGALMGAQAILMATDSGDTPFDEVNSRPWLVLQERHPGKPIPLANFATTVELRGQADTTHEFARDDAAALIEFLRRRGIVGGTPAPLPAPLCEPTPLAASEPVTTPVGGVIVFHHKPGDRVAAGSRIADIVYVHSGAVTPLHCQSAGVLYARIATRWALPGDRLCKVAGTLLARTGKLLGA